MTARVGVSAFRRLTPSNAAEPLTSPGREQEQIQNAIHDRQIDALHTINIEDSVIEGHVQPDADAMGGIGVLHAALAKAFGKSPKIAYVGDPLDSRFLEMYEFEKHTIAFGSDDRVSLLVDANDRMKPNVAGAVHVTKAASFCWDHHEQLVTGQFYYVDEKFCSSGAQILAFTARLFERKGISLIGFFHEHPKLAMLLALGIMVDEKVNFHKLLTGDYTGLSDFGKRSLQFLLNNRFFEPLELLSFDIKKDPRYSSCERMLASNLAGPAPIELASGETFRLYTGWVVGPDSYRSFVGGCADDLLAARPADALVMVYHFVTSEDLANINPAQWRIPPPTRAADNRIRCSMRKHCPSFPGAPAIKASHLAALIGGGDGSGRNTASGFCMPSMLDVVGGTLKEASRDALMITKYIIEQRSAVPRARTDSGAAQG